jgi:hypothetical protein
LKFPLTPPSPQRGEEKGEGAVEIRSWNYMENTFLNSPNPPLIKGDEGDLRFSYFVGGQIGYGQFVCDL